MERGLVNVRLALWRRFRSYNSGRVGDRGRDRFVSTPRTIKGLDFGQIAATEL